METIISAPVILIFYSIKHLNYCFWNGVLIGYVNGVGSEQDVLERIEEVLGDWGLVPKKKYDKIALDSAKAKAGLLDSNMKLYPTRQ